MLKYCILQLFLQTRTMRVGEVPRKHWFQRNSNQKTVSRICICYKFIYCIFIQVKVGLCKNMSQNTGSCAPYLSRNQCQTLQLCPLVVIIIYIIISESSSIITVLDNDENLLTTFDDGYDDVTQYDDEVKEMCTTNLSSVSDTERGLLLTDSEYIVINYLTELFIIRQHHDR